MTRFLSLQSDKILLSDQEQKTLHLIKDFFFAVLHANGDLVVMINTKTIVFENVKPSGTVPQFCRDLRLLLYQTQIMIVKRSCLEDVVVIETSKKNIGSMYEELCVKYDLASGMLAGQDIVLCRFKNRYISIFAFPEDSNHFCSILRRKNSNQYSIFTMAVDFQKSDIMCA